MRMVCNRVIGLRRIFFNETKVIGGSAGCGYDCSFFSIEVHLVLVCIVRNLFLEKKQMPVCSDGAKDLSN